MNYSEFKRMLFSDPANPDPEYQAARKSAPEFAQAAADSDAFELRLKRATRVPEPAGWSEQLKKLAVDNPSPAQTLPGFQQIYRFRYALAATLMLALSVVALTQQLQAPETVEGYVARHFAKDGEALMVAANTPNAARLVDVLADFDLHMSPELSDKVLYVKHCPTPKGQGVHLVLSTDQGKVTVIFMPGLQVQEGERFAFEKMETLLINLPGQDVSAAIIGHAEQLPASQSPILGSALQKGVWRQSADA